MSKFILLITIILSPFCFANTSEGKDLRIDKNNNVIENDGTDINLATTHQYLSSQVLGFADFIDSFFGRYTRTDKKNKSRIIITSRSEVVEFEGARSKIKLEARLNLPHLEELLKFKVNKQKRIENVQKIDLHDTDKKDIEEVDSYYFVDWKLSSQVGVDVSLKPDVFANLTNKFEFGGRKNIIRMEDMLFVYGRSGLGNRLSFEYDHLFSNSFFLRLENSATWQADSGEILYSHGPELYISINESTTLFYDIKARGHKTDLSKWAIKQYDSSLVYNKRLKFKWLYLKTGPVIEFAKDHEFQSKLSYFFLFQVFIGSF